MCQSVGLAFRAAAYEARPGGALGTAVLAGGVGVATLVPSGVCASTLDPSVATCQYPNAIIRVLSSYLRLLLN